MLEMLKVPHARVLELKSMSNMHPDDYFNVCFINNILLGE